MRKRIVAFLIAFVLILTFSSCGLIGKLIPTKPEPVPSPVETDPTDTTPTPKPTKEINTHSPKPTQEVKVIYDDSLIREAYSEDGTYTDQWNNKYDYSYHLPQIDLDKPGARELNESIDYVVGDAIREALDSYENDVGSGLLDVYWKSAWNGSVVSLLVECVYDWAYTDYLVYHYDCEKDEILYNHDILQMIGMSEDEFVQRARRTAELEFDGNNYFYLTEYAGNSGYDVSFAETRNRTLDDFSIDAGIQIFPAEKTMVVLPIGSMAGASSYQHLLELAPMPEQLTRFGFTRFVTSEVGTGYGKIVLEDVPEYEEVISYLELVCRVTRGQEYYISGLYSEYTDIQVCFLDDYDPFLFLTTVRGEVECVDIFMGLMNDSLCAFQLQGIGNINYTFFDEDDINGLGYSCVAYAADGSFHDLTPYVMQSKEARHCFYPDHLSSSYYDTLEDGTESECIRYLDMLDDNSFQISTLIVETGDYTTYNGLIEFLGCNEDGVVYSYYIYETGELGSIACRRIEDNYLVTSYGRGGQIFSTYQYGSALYVPTYG